MEKKPPWMYPFMAFLVPAIYLLWAPLRGQYYWSADTSHLFYVLKRWLWNRVSDVGELPLWNEGLFGGIYQMASPAHEAFSPLTFPFYFLFSEYGAVLASLACGLGLAGLGAYVLAREWKVGSSSALAFGWSFAFVGPLLSLVDRSPIFLGVALYPWLGLLVTKFERRPTWGTWAGIGMVLALLFHHGDWIAAAFFMVGLSVLAIWDL
ncbi:MAG: hypothetical protein KDD43_10120, partial [Bdellovibrionales bacterium]|nr:hypothetical protein [Bdellovibrionales bacterium]